MHLLWLAMTCAYFGQDQIRRKSFSPSGRHGGLMVSTLKLWGSSPGRGHCVVFLGKTLHSHCASLHPGVYKWVLANLMLGGNPAMD